MVLINNNMTRIEMHLTDDETKAIETIAKEQGRSREKQCEVVIRDFIIAANDAGK